MSRPFKDVALLARNRIKKSLREQLTVASARTLEIKLSERGPDNMQLANPPHVVTEAIKKLFYFGDVKTVASPDPDDGLPNAPCKLFTLTSTTIDAAELSQILDVRIYLEQVYYDHASRYRMTLQSPDTIGKCGERAARKAFQSAGGLIVAENWGDIKDPRIIGASDGILYSNVLPVKNAMILVEIKNQREWIYHDAPVLWKHIKNSYNMNAIPLFVARRIYRSAFEYVLKRVGGLGLETRTQFAPPAFEEALTDAKHAYGLDYFDLRFTDEPGPRLLNRTRALSKQIVIARERMEQALPIVSPYVDILADENVRGNHRRKAYYSLQAALNKAKIEPISLVPEDYSQ